MSSSFKYTNKYTLQKPINKEMYEQAEAQGLQIYDTAGRRAVGVDSATGKVKYEYENQPSNSSVTIPGTETTGGKIGGDVGKITHDNLTGTGDGTGTKTSVFKPLLPQKSPEKLPGTVDTPKITKLPLKVNDGVYKPETTWRTTPKASALSEGQRAYSEVEAALSTMYSPQEYQGLLSKVTPEKLEQNLPVADSVIKKNIDSGRVSADYDKKHPLMRNGLAFTFSDDGTFTKKDYQILDKLKYSKEKPKTETPTSSYKYVQPFQDLYEKSIGKIIDITWDQMRKRGTALKDSFSSIYNDIIDSLEPVLSKLEEAKNDSEQLPEEKTKEPVYYSQLDERWAGQTYGEGLNIEKAGCGITSMAMILSTLTGEAVTPPEMAKYSTDIGTAEDGTDISFFKKAAEEYGLKATDSYWAYQYYDSKIKDDLNNGSMYVTNLFPKGSVWSDGHFIVVSDYVESDDGNYFVAYDPNFDNAITYYKNGVTVDETTEGKIYIPEDVLRKDARYMIGISK